MSNIQFKLALHILFLIKTVAFLKRFLDKDELLVQIILKQAGAKELCFIHSHLTQSDVQIWLHIKFKKLWYDPR